MRNIPARYEDVKYPEDVPEKVLEAFRKIKETKKGLYLYGPVGSGKTHIAYALKKKWDEYAPYKAEFWVTAEFLQAIKDDFDRPMGDKMRAFERMMEEKGVVFLDDIGAEKSSEWVLDRLLVLINRRNADKLPIIFTSNLSIADLAAKTEDRIASRIVEMCEVVHIDGPDRRLS